MRKRPAAWNGLKKTRSTFLQGLSDEDLVKKVLGGNEHAFSLLAFRLRPRIFSVANDILRNAGEAEDMVQEVLLVVHQALARFRGESKLSTWVYQIARNRSLNRLKYLKRRGFYTRLELIPSISEQAHMEVGSPKASDFGKPLEVLLRAEGRMFLTNALTRLSLAQRKLIVLCDIEDLPYAEIATRTGLCIGTVKSRLHRARRQLLLILREHEEWGRFPPVHE